MTLNIEIILSLCSIVATAAVPFIVVIWQSKREKTKFVDAIKVCDTFTKEIIPSFIEFNNIFDTNEMSFLNEIHSDENNSQLLIPFKVESEEMKKCLDINKSCFLLNAAMLLFNKLDVFSAQILTLNESEQLYAKTLSRNAFVDIIQKYSVLYDILMFEHENDYVNLRCLYELWK